MARWKINNEVLSKNPSTAIKKPTKQVEYRDTILGNVARITSYDNTVTMVIEASWTAADVALKDKFKQLYLNSTVFLLETHLARDVWTVYIDSFNAEHTVLKDVPIAKYYNVSVTFKSTKGVVE